MSNEQKKPIISISIYDDGDTFHSVVAGKTSDEYINMFVVMFHDAIAAMYKHHINERAPSCSDIIQEKSKVIN